MPAGPVVVNSTPLVVFWAIGRLDILCSLFGKIVIPPAVREEFLSTEKEARRITLRDETPYYPYKGSSRAESPSRSTPRAPILGEG